MSMFPEEFKGEIFIPDKTPLKEALKRTTFLCVAAHHDDIEIMALPGILKAFRDDDLFFTGVVLTNGQGSLRTGHYAHFSEGEMMAIRKKEQKKAAFIGEYSALILLDYSSHDIKRPQREIILTIKEIVTETNPRVIYTHNLADKHHTHVAVSLRLIEALRSLPPYLYPKKVYGCEVWRDLDWLCDEEKVSFDVSQQDHLASSLIGVFDSQISHGKRYDLAIKGRRRAHATFSSTLKPDTTSSLGYAMDLTPLIKKDGIEIKDYVLGSIQRFAKEVEDTITLLSHTGEEFIK